MNVAFNIGELHASAGRRIREREEGLGKGRGISRGRGGKERARTGVAMGKFGAFEIRVAVVVVVMGRRERGREARAGGVVSCVCRIADALTVPRACVTSPLVPPLGSYRETAPLSLPATPDRRPLTANRPSSIHERGGTAVLPLSSFPSPSSPPSSPRVYILASAPAPVPDRALPPFLPRVGNP